jgi:hypothetical protein
MRFGPGLRYGILLAALGGATACGSDDGDEGTIDAAVGVDAAPGPDAAAGAPYALSVTLNGYGMAHNGHTLYFALYDDADDTAPVATDTLEIMGGGGGGGGGGGNAVTFPGALEHGQSYTLYWYADTDANMTCDSGVDPHWRIEVPAVTMAVSETHHASADSNGDCARH